MDSQLIRSHLNRARAESRNSFEEYDALWAAFNVMYEGTRPGLIIKSQKEPRDRQTIRYCAKKLDYEEWSQLFKSENFEKLRSIAPIFNERDWLRHAKINTREFDNLVKKTKKGLTGIPEADEEALEALVDLLYIVRCNRHHGFKTYDRPRDREVLDATVPILRELVTKLATHFEAT